MFVIVREKNKNKNISRKMLPGNHVGLLTGIRAHPGYDCRKFLKKKVRLVIIMTSMVATPPQSRGLDDPFSFSRARCKRIDRVNIHWVKSTRTPDALCLESRIIKPNFATTYVTISTRTSIVRKMVVCISVWSGGPSGAASCVVVVEARRRSWRPGSVSRWALRFLLRCQLPIGGSARSQ